MSKNLAASTQRAKLLGDCPICSRPMVDDGCSTDKHHLIPKSRGGVATTRLHRVCHSFIHSMWTEKELEQDFCDPEAIKAVPEAQIFIAWVAKKDPQFYDKSTRHSRKGARRR